MPWLSIIMAIISFLATLKKDKSNVGRAALVGAAAGLGTYYVTHETEWGRTNLGSLDGVVTVEPGSDVTGPVSTTNGGVPVKVPVSQSANTSTGSSGQWWNVIGDNLVPLGAGVVLGASTSKEGSWIPWALLIGGVLLLTR